MEKKSFIQKKTTTQEPLCIKISQVIDHLKTIFSKHVLKPKERLDIKAPFVLHLILCIKLDWVQSRKIKLTF